mmetsp:Transcript_27995/g.71371  ORF Transcript_27995/g.71371 Transcript_27995/m.71371 type:complete len:290 (+) Transcript_27995:2469-3338(+)
MLASPHTQHKLLQWRVSQLRLQRRAPAQRLWQWRLHSQWRRGRPTARMLPWRMQSRRLVRVRQESMRPRQGQIRHMRAGVPGPGGLAHGQQLQPRLLPQGAAAPHTRQPSQGTRCRRLMLRLLLHRVPALRPIPLLQLQPPPASPLPSAAAQQTLVRVAVRATRSVPRLPVARALQLQPPRPMREQRPLAPRLRQVLPQAAGRGLQGQARARSQGELGRRRAQTGRAGAGRCLCWSPAGAGRTRATGRRRRRSRRTPPAACGGSSTWSCSCARWSPSAWTTPRSRRPPC